MYSQNLPNLWNKRDRTKHLVRLGGGGIVTSRILLKDFRGVINIHAENNLPLDVIQINNLDKCVNDIGCNDCLRVALISCLKPHQTYTWCV